MLKKEENIRILVFESDSFADELPADYAQDYMSTYLFSDLSL